MQITCFDSQCQQVVDVMPRPADWRGGIRRQFTCPRCGYQGHYKTAPQGFISPRPPVTIAFMDRNAVTLQEYQCEEPQAQRFATQFLAAWQQIPSVARHVVIGHWARDAYAPYVWLLNDSREWNGQGWAAATPDGFSLFFVAQVVKEIPDEHIRLFVAHELAHTLFTVCGEEQHSIPRRTQEIAYRCERLVWDMMKAWRFDQIAAEEWMEQNFEGPVKRSDPLTGAAYQGDCVKEHERIESELSNFPFPAAFEKYRVSGP